MNVISSITTCVEIMYLFSSRNKNVSDYSYRCTRYLSDLPYITENTPFSLRNPYALKPAHSFFFL